MDNSLERSLQEAGGHLRDVFPDWAKARLVKVMPDERGEVELSNGARMTIPFPPAGASSVGEGTEGQIGFRQGNFQLPFWRTCETPGRRSTQKPSLFTDWVRRGARYLQRWFLPDLDVGADSAIQVANLEMPDELPDANIVRTQGGRRIVAAGSTLREESEETNEVTVGPTDLGADIESCHVDDDNNIVSITSEIVVSVECGEVFEEAYELAIQDENAFDAGYSTCEGGQDYFGNLQGRQFTWLDENPVPSQYSDCATEWENGGYTGIKELFDEGYTDAGCTPPPT